MRVCEFVDEATALRGAVAFKPRFELPVSWRVSFPWLFKALFVEGGIAPAEVAGVVSVGSCHRRKWDCVLDHRLGRWDRAPHRAARTPNDIDFAVVPVKGTRFQDVCMSAERQAIRRGGEYEASLVRKDTALHLFGVAEKMKGTVANGCMVFGDEAAVADSLGVVPCCSAKCRSRLLSWLLGPLLVVPVSLRDEPEGELSTTAQRAMTFQRGMTEAELRKYAQDPAD